MNVRLIESTARAKEVLILAKQTRRLKEPKAWDEILSMSPEELDAELEYVFHTIRSSWEFVDFTFLITGVTRAFTHQLVRHRTGVSFAQQAQRIVTMEDFEYLATGKMDDEPEYHDVMKAIQKGYYRLISVGHNPQDVRGILPTNILTAILFKVNLRELDTIMNTRLCFRAQGEFQNVALALRREAILAHPFLDRILLPFCLEFGACKFPKFDECPLKKQVMSQQQFALDALDKTAKHRLRKIWEEKIGKPESDFQPK